jgi:F-type H+-transporting ATPase subunit O
MRPGKNCPSHPSPRCLPPCLQPLSKAEVDDLAAGLKKMLKPGETLMLNEKVDPAIIGGVVVDIGDRHLDMSILSRVRKLQQIVREAI